MCERKVRFHHDVPVHHAEKLCYPCWTMKRKEVKKRSNQRAVKKRKMDRASMHTANSTLRSSFSTFPASAVVVAQLVASPPRHADNMAVSATASMSPSTLGTPATFPAAPTITGSATIMLSTAVAAVVADNCADDDDTFASSSSSSSSSFSVSSSASPSSTLLASGVASPSSTRHVSLSQWYIQPFNVSGPCTCAKVCNHEGKGVPNASHCSSLCLA